MHSKCHFFLVRFTHVLSLSLYLISRPIFKKMGKRNDVFLSISCIICILTLSSFKYCKNKILNLYKAHT
jgi:putative effector of murein hydrolase